MQELIGLLTRASKAYYAEDREIMSNFEYDRLYDELAALEKRAGIVLAGSPTVHVGYTAADDAFQLYLFTRRAKQGNNGAEACLPLVGRIG